MLDFARQLSISGVLNYALWRARGKQDSVTLSLKSGKKILLRKQDYGVAYEIFVHKFYELDRPINRSDVKLIVDVGANVGFSGIYFLQEYPAAHLIAFEAHPRNVERVRANLALNSAMDRVTLYPVAACDKSGQVMLSDLGASSSTKNFSKKARLIPVEGVDVFSILLGKQIDILKMDIEGGEYDILADDRFLNLDVRMLVMEWHQMPGDRDDHAWCVDRLVEAGYEVKDLFVKPDYGMFWAFKSSKTGSSVISAPSHSESATAPV